MATQTLTDAERNLLEQVDFSEDQTIYDDQMTDQDRKIAAKLVRKGLLDVGGERSLRRYEVTLAGRYIIEPEATTELYGPQK